MVEVYIENRIAYLILNRPEKRNALDDSMAQEILKHLNNLKKNNECKVLVIKAKGEAFCAGADLGYLQKLQNNSFHENLEDSRALMHMFKALYEFPKITISQVEGPALAGGCGLASLCDFCFATENAKFGYTEVKIGFIPAIVSVFLGPKIGDNLARTMLLTGKLYSAEEALKMNLINEICDVETIAQSVMDFANKLTISVSEDSVRLTKELLKEIKGNTLDDQLNMAAEANAKARATADCKKGISAFLNKEKIVW
jgi:methylglutaconyl-CoA hydratase